MLENEKFDLFITSDFPPGGGGESRYFDLVTRSYPCEAVVLTIKHPGNPNETDRNDKVEIRRVKNIRFLTPILFFLHVLLFTQKKRIRFIHCGQMRAAGPTCLLLKLFFKIPYGIHVYGGERSKFADAPFWRAFLKPILGNASIIFANSRWTKEQWIEYGLDPERVIVINPPVDVEKYHPLPDRNAVRAALGMAEKKVLLTICRLDPHKGTDTVIRAMPELVKLFPDILFVVGGKGRMLDYLQSLTRELKVEKHVKFIGRVPDSEMIKWYNAADIFIMPSRLGKGADRGVEGFGIVYLEANLCGRPVIGGRSGGTSDAVEDGVSGMLVNPESAGEITEAVAKMLRSPDMMEKFGAAGRKRAVEQFSSEVISRKLHDAVSGCLQQS